MFEKLELDSKAFQEGFSSHETKMQWAKLEKAGVDPGVLLAKYRPVEFPKKPVPNPERRKKGVLERRDMLPQQKVLLLRERLNRIKKA